MKTIAYWAVVALFGTVVINDAYALTLKSGQVLSSDGQVMAANETANGKRQLAEKGYLIAAGNLHLDVDGETVTVALNDLKGKSKTEIKDIIIEAAGEELSSATHDVALEAEFEAAGVAVADTVEEALSTGGIDTAVNEANEAVAAAVEQAANDFINDPDGVNAEAIADGHEIYVGDPNGAPNN